MPYSARPLFVKTDVTLYRQIVHPIAEWSQLPVVCQALILKARQGATSEVFFKKGNFRKYPSQRLCATTTGIRRLLKSIRF